MLRGNSSESLPEFLIDRALPCIVRAAQIEHARVESVPLHGVVVQVDHQASIFLSLVFGGLEFAQFEQVGDGWRAAAESVLLFRELANLLRREGCA